MQVKLLTSRAGADFSQAVGEVVTVNDAEAVRMIEAGQAEPVSAPKKETATKKGYSGKGVVIPFLNTPR